VHSHLVVLICGHTRCLIVIDIDPVELEVAVTMICAGGINTMLITDNLPELQDIIHIISYLSRLCLML